ncbi:Serine/threonine-protein kinase STY46 [Hypsizygus marmoreus]|uniref:Serine/threonine-protein kinase STY46 n=1 Tax=Hypsizygus marmoreus TaxID=39966 RepID=A0A369JSR6_HYPMA|nr:Serine/threonine-protein kinase STY46 [Hypsizygus marmoreus]
MRSTPCPSPVEDLFDISDQVVKMEPHYFAMGEVSDVYRCQFVQMDGSKHMVAVKVIRGLTSDIDSILLFKQDVAKLVARWKRLFHPNLMECYGTCYGFGHLTGLVLPLCGNGSIVKYLEHRSIVEKLDKLSQVAAAVQYLHSGSFVHADIRGANILMRDETPLLMDAGLAPLVSRGDFTVTSFCGRPRWAAPEIVSPPEDSSDDILHTFKSDVYALGMTILEVVTGREPFSHRRYDTAVMMDVIQGLRPNRPQDPCIADNIWDIIVACWQDDPQARPTATLVESWLSAAHMLVKTEASA